MGTKASALTAYASTLASTDLVTIVDVSDTTHGAGGTSKKMTIANLIANSPNGGLAEKGAANTFTAAQTFSASIVATNRIYTGSITLLADDTVTTITPPANAGMIVFSPFNAFSANRNEAMAVIGYLLSVPAIQVLAQPATRVTVGTSVLAGTTGTDGTLNIGGVAGPLLYIENRLGLTISFNYMILL